MTFVGFAVLAACSLVAQTAPAENSQTLPVLDSRALSELLGRLGYSANAAEIGAIWAWEEPAECARQIARRYSIPETTNRQICELPKKIVGEPIQSDSNPVARGEKTAGASQRPTSGASEANPLSQSMVGSSTADVTPVRITSSVPSSRTIRFRPESQNMSLEYVDGKAVYTVQADGIIVSTSLFDSDKATIAEVMVLNDSPRNIHVLPKEVDLYALAPNYKLITRKDPQKMIASIDRNERWTSALDEIAASFAKQQVTSTSNTQGSVNLSDMRGNSASGSYSGSTITTVTMPDWQTRRAAAIRTIRRKGQAESSIDFITRSALRANTLRPGGQIAGYVWFDRDSALRKAGTQIILQLQIDECTFQFPYAGLK